MQQDSSTNPNVMDDDSNDSFASSAHSSSTTSSFSSSSSSNDDLNYMPKSFFLSSQYSESNRMFRRRGAVGDNDDDNTVAHSNSNNLPFRHRRRNNTSNSGFCSYSTIALVSTFLLWCYTQFLAPFDNSNDNNDFSLVPWSNRPIRERTQARAQQNKQRRPSSSFLESFRSWRESFPQQHKKTSSSESLPPHCEPLPWHAHHYPNCNLVHTMDLPDLSRHHMYIASGLWRSVWKYSNNMDDDDADAAVVKIMKSDHKVTLRNFERHRRDAVVMERYTASPYVVDIYGFCGNTVVTEHSPQPLDGVVILREAGSASQQQQRQLAPLSQRIAWARDVARGVAVLHADHVVHADLQAKQFLLSHHHHHTDDDDATNNGAVVVKINDFNRCRFMAMKTTTVVMENNTDTTATIINTTTPCEFIIPSAPGKQRSPEEYNSEMLSEKLDIYSLANIFMAIWSGERPWDNFGAGETKRMIVKGWMPPSPFSHNNKTTDALWNITTAAYARNPNERPSAHEIAETLDRILLQQQLLEEEQGR